MIRIFGVCTIILFVCCGSHTNLNQVGRPGGKDFALFFAVEQYDQATAWKSLPGVIRESEAIATDLKELYGFSETKIVKNPTLAEIDAELETWRKRKFEPDDQLLVFFSGHGQYVDDRKQGYFIPRDGRGSSGSMYERKWLPYLDLRRLVTGINCRHILLALDACYSGTADDQVALKDETEDWAEPSGAQDHQWNQQIHDQLRCQSRILLTSGGKTKTENPSKFAASFRQAFAKLGGADRIVRPTDIKEEWFGLAIQPHATTFEGHESCGNFLFVYQSKLNTSIPANPVHTNVKAAGKIDFDDDGIPDSDDKCPAEKGAASAKGCPDADGDGVPDHMDQCKDKAGLSSNNGCPLQQVFVNPLATSMVEVEGGKFKMGRSNGSKEEQPIHDVELSTFRISRHEVTVGQYLSFCEATDKHWPIWLEKKNSYNIESGSIKFYRDIGMSRSNSNLPVTGISWYDAVAFCEWLSEKTGKQYRLPTEAEWEFAARGGLRSLKYSFAGGVDIKKVGWCSENANNQVHMVGALTANEIGLYDMSGNVMEWCADWYDENYYKVSPKSNPKGALVGERKVCRGGSWFFGSDYCLNSSRYHAAPTERSSSVGFRVVLD